MNAPPQPWRHALWPLLLCTLVACEGESFRSDVRAVPGDAMHRSTSQPSTASMASSADPPQGTTRQPVTHPPNPKDCAEENAPSLQESRFMRLTQHQWRRSLQQIFPGVPLADLVLPADSNDGGFRNQGVNLLDVSSMRLYLEAAQSVGERVVSGGLLGPWCSDASSVACAEALADKVAPLLYRRPLVPQERQRLLDRWRANRATWDNGGLATGTLIAQMLLGTPFLFLVEAGEGADGSQEVIDLTGYEVATRLSMLLWGAGPDQELFDVADRLREPGVLEAQFERMIQSERFIETMQDFFGQWMGTDKLDTVQHSGDLYPEFTPQIARDLSRETHAFVRHIFEQKGGSYKEMLTADYSFLNGSLRQYYDVGEDQGQAFEKVTFAPEAHRGGLLRQGAIIASHTKDEQIAHILRGAFVVHDLLCTQLDAIPDIPQGVDPATNPGCTACHNLIEPLGYAFDRYDAIGRLRTQRPTGAAVDASGELVAGPGAQKGSGVPFVGVQGFGHVLIKDPRGASCLTKKAITYELKQEADLPAQACLISKATEAFAQQDTSILAVLKTLVLDPSFLQRRRVSAPTCQE